MTTEINNIIYALSLLITAIPILYSKSSISSYFSRTKIMNTIKNEVGAVEDALGKISTIKYFQYDRYLFIASITSMLSAGFFHFHITTDNFVLSIVILYFLFNAFHGIEGSRMRPLLSKSIEETLSSFKSIYNQLGISISAILWSIFTLILIYVANFRTFESIFSFNSGFFVSIIVSILAVGYILFMTSVLKRQIERNYLVMLSNESKLPPIHLKIKMKNDSEVIKGQMISTDLNYITIDEFDGYRLCIDYSKIEMLSSKRYSNDDPDSKSQNPTPEK